MQSIELPTSGVNINLTNRELDLVSNALLVRVKTFRASIEKMRKKNGSYSYIIKECEVDEAESYALLHKIAQLQGIDRETVEAQLGKNPWLKNV